MLSTSFSLPIMFVLLHNMCVCVCININIFLDALVNFSGEQSSQFRIPPVGGSSFSGGPVHNVRGETSHLQGRESVHSQKQDHSFSSLRLS